GSGGTGGSRDLGTSQRTTGGRANANAPGGDPRMSQASGVRSALPAVSVVTSADSGGKLWKRWQITYVVGRAVFLIGFFLLMEYHHGRDPSLLLDTLFGSKLSLHATALLAVGTLLELVLFAVLNRWRDRL